MRPVFDSSWSSGWLFLDLGPDSELDDRFFEECLQEKIGRPPVHSWDVVDGSTGRVVVRKFGYVEAYLSFLTLKFFLQAWFVAVWFVGLPPKSLSLFHSSYALTDVGAVGHWTPKTDHLPNWIGGCKLELPCRYW